MENRTEPLDSLDLFATPPWGSRALMEYVLPAIGLTAPLGTCWEPAAGLGHMSDPLGEYFTSVFASDVHDYGRGHAIGSFVGEGADVIRCPFKPDWVITNPPFKLGEEFVRHALATATVGVAMLARTAFIESGARYPLFSDPNFRTFAPFSGRLPMVKGRWDPTASSATSYSWFVWTIQPSGREPTVIMIPPDAQRKCSRPDDVKEFAARC